MIQIWSSFLEIKDLIDAAAEFQFSTISLLANKVVNAIKSFLAAEKVSEVGHTLNKAVKALGAIWFPVTSENRRKVSDKNLFVEGHVHNLCECILNNFANMALV